MCVHSRCALVRVLFDGANECIRYIDIDQSSCPKSFIPALKYIHNIFFLRFLTVVVTENEPNYTQFEMKSETVFGSRRISHNFDNQRRNGKRNHKYPLVYFKYKNVFSCFSPLKGEIEIQYIIVNVEERTMFYVYTAKSTEEHTEHTNATNDCRKSALSVYTIFQMDFGATVPYFGFRCSHTHTHTIAPLLRSFD